jgi:hypothetical protein
MARCARSRQRAGCGVIVPPNNPDKESPMPAAKELRDRALRYVLAAPAATAHTLRALSVVESVHTERTKNSRDPHLSDAGRLAKTRAALPPLARRYALSTAGVEREKAALKSDRAALEKKAFEKFSNDGLGSEIRAALKALPHGEKLKLAAEDPRILAALASAPPIVTGVTSDALAHIVQGYLERNHAPTLAKLDAKGEAIEVAEAALQITRNSLHEAGGFPHAQALNVWLAENATPDALALGAEANGKAPTGHRAWTMDESIQLTNTDALTGLPK